jgi:hypothetical protein
MWMMPINGGVGVFYNKKRILYNFNYLTSGTIPEKNNIGQKIKG